MSEERGLLTAVAVAKQLKVSRMTVTRWARDGYLSFVQMPSGRRCYQQADIDRFLEERRQERESA